MAELTTKQAFDLAVQHHEAGRLQAAEELYRQILSQQPGHAEALHLLGVAAHQAGRNDAAVDMIRRAIALRPHFADAHTNLGVVLVERGQINEAIAAHRQAISLNPQFDKAHNNLAIALRRTGQLDQAVAECRRAISLNPNYAKAYNNLGILLRDQGLLDEAIAAFRRSVALNPSNPEALSNLGAALRDKGQFDEAIAEYRRAIALSPGFASAHLNLALALLAKGDFRQGWEEHEWRWKCNDFPSPARNFSQPQWDGQPLLDEQTLLLHAEQGLGDTLQFIRYLPQVAQRCGKIALDCQAELQRLLEIIAGGRPVVARGQPLAPFDLHCPLLSLPHLFGMTLDNIPKNTPYVRPDPADAMKWQARLADHSRAVKVGLAWAGNAIHKNDRDRSIKLATFAPLGHVPGTQFFSLQKGNAATEAKTPPAGLELVDWTEELKDFADTAALVANLDLVISVDTAVAHLAGAMGKPVWTLLSCVPDWRWLQDREDSPWYPSMRLFRQPTRGDWESVIERVAGTLANWADRQR